VEGKTRGKQSQVCWKRAGRCHSEGRRWEEEGESPRGARQTQLAKAKRGEGKTEYCWKKEGCLGEETRGPVVRGIKQAPSSQAECLPHGRGKEVAVVYERSEERTHHDCAKKKGKLLVSGDREGTEPTAKRLTGKKGVLETRYIARNKEFVRGEKKRGGRRIHTFREGEEDGDRFHRRERKKQRAHCKRRRRRLML